MLLQYLCNIYFQESLFYGNVFIKDKKAKRRFEKTCHADSQTSDEPIDHTMDKSEEVIFKLNIKVFY